MKCLIIAAGRGIRLSSRGDSKPFVPLLGLPLIEKPLFSIIFNLSRTGGTDSKRMIFILK